jgi:hypothetical protein
MPAASWKRRGSPIGRKGPRKAHPKYKRHIWEAWTPKDVRELKNLAKQNMPTGVLSLKLGRPPAAIRKPINRSPYNRRKAG